MSGWTYMLRCADGSYYVGSTSYADVHIRVAEHNDARFIGYTSRRRPMALVWATFFEDLRDVHETERRIKGWNRQKKEALLAGDEEQLIAAAARRGGKPQTASPTKSKREVSWEAQATGAKHKSSLAQRQTPKNSLHRERTPEEARAAWNRRPLIPHGPRHPEVRAKRAPKDE